MADEFIHFTDENAPGPEQARATGRVFVGHQVTPADWTRFMKECTQGKWNDPAARYREELRLHTALTRGGRK
jgi:hypothetical protein